MKIDQKRVLFSLCYVVSAVLLVAAYWLSGSSENSFIYHYVSAHRAGQSVDDSSVSFVKYLWITTCLLGLNIALIPTLYEKNFHLGSFKVEKHGVILLISIALYCSVFISVTLYKFYQLHYHIQDLGIFSQIVWNTSRGDFFQNTIDTPNFLGRHANFILVVFALGYKIFNQQTYLLVIQTLWLAAGAVPVYLIALHFLRSRNVALLFSISYLLYAPLHGVNQFEFHFEPFCIVVILFALLFLVKEKMVLFWIVIVIALLIKENIPLYTAGIGLYMILAKLKRKQGVVLFVLSITYFLFLIEFFMPFFRGPDWHGFNSWSNFAALVPNGGGLSEALGTILFRPLTVLKVVMNVKKLYFVMVIMTPLCFLPFFSKKALVLLLFPFSVSLLASDSGLFSVYVHNVGSIVPFVYFTSIVGLTNLGTWRLFPSFRRIILVNLVTLGIITTFQIDFLKNKEYYLLESPNTYSRFVFEVVDRIPADASVSVQNDLGVPFAERKQYYFFPEVIKESDYIVFNPHSFWYTMGNKEPRSQADKTVDSLINNRLYTVRYNYRDTIIVLGRNHPLPNK